MATTSMVTSTVLLPSDVSSVLEVLPIPIWKGMVMLVSFPLNTVFNLQKKTICLTYRTLEVLGELLALCQQDNILYSQQDKHAGGPTANRTNMLEDLQSTG